MTARISHALNQINQINQPPPPATPAEARPDGMRAFPNGPCSTQDCVGDYGHAGDCATLAGVAL